MKKILLALLMMSITLQANAEKKEEEKLQKECDNGNSISCAKVGYEYLFVDNPKSVEFLEKSCNLKMVQSCLVLGTMYENHDDFGNDYAKAKKFYGKACDLKDQDGCKEYTKLSQKGY
ncbi:hypothetical protein CQA57_08005 [Helicobacter anseris]|uniref:Beta-lactamase n=1 Tax=Helicobacter anseris TaxID=375926 RepID=A0A3D8J2K0_9HELI|nr:sel1 repeat family protein [Helicobacter anseris]RDU71084.1 hypothetical protein CQA57_08005 [Helicobacter anseris]